MDFEERFDVIVAGAGVAGIAAALECARSGLTTALVEKTLLTGGLATSGLIYAYLPLCDGNGRQVTFGIAEELLHLSIRYGPGDVPAGWRSARNAPEALRYFTTFSPAAFVLALDEALEEAGVHIRLDTLVCAPVMESDRVVGVEVENTDGRGVFRAACLIDATGDALLAYRAGATCVTADNWLSVWALNASLEKAQEAVRAGSGHALLDLLALGGDHTGEGLSGEEGKFDGTSARELTRFVLEGRKLLREHYRKSHAKGGISDRHNVFPVALPTLAQFRTTRHVVGRVTLSDDQHGRRADDAIGMVADWRKPGCIWEIPYGTLVPKEVKGLLVAGRCISSEGDAWEVTRVIPAAALTGQAAGAAAVLSVKSKTPADELDPEEVQQRLRQHGIPLHIDEITT